jgi:DNA-binding IclR family transcriptional regulator
MVARRSPQTERVIAVLNLLTVDSSGEGVTLSEIARRLGLSKATCYPMLEALVDAGFLSRHPARKTFHLGPALVAVGAAAARRNPRRERASEAMIRLGHQLGLTCWLYAPDGAHLRVIDQAWHSRKTNPILRVGEHFDFRPPTGAVIVAWGGQQSVEEWLDRGAVVGEMRDSYLARLQQVRDRGYAISLEQMAIDELRSAVAHLANATTLAERSRLFDLLVEQHYGTPTSILTDVDPDATYSVQSIDAPIFDEGGEVSMALGLTNLPMLTGRRIEELAGQLLRVANAVNA